MKSKLLKIVAVLAVLLLVLVVIIATRPGEFRVARSATVNTPPASVFAHVNELKKWEPWNPWGKVDPDMKLTYDGPASGVGASYAWVGNHEVGEGKGTITEVRTNELVQLKLEFFKPMAGVSIAEFTFKPQGNQTEVTWTMSGKNNFIGKAMCMIMNMDKMIGGQFEKGLADLKAAAESQVIADRHFRNRTQKPNQRTHHEIRRWIRHSASYQEHCHLSAHREEGLQSLA